MGFLERQLRRRITKDADLVVQASVRIQTGIPWRAEVRFEWSAEPADRPWLECLLAMNYATKILSNFPEGLEADVAWHGLQQPGFEIQSYEPLGSDEPTATYYAQLWRAPGKSGGVPFIQTPYEPRGQEDLLAPASVVFIWDVLRKQSSDAQVRIETGIELLQRRIGDFPSFDAVGGRNIAWAVVLELADRGLVSPPDQETVQVMRAVAAL